MENQIVNKTHTEAALDMLVCIMQKVTWLTLNAEQTRADYYDNMSGIAIGLADAINQIENNVEELDCAFTPDEVME